MNRPDWRQAYLQEMSVEQRHMLATLLDDNVLYCLVFSRVRALFRRMADGVHARAMHLPIEFDLHILYGFKYECAHPLFDVISAARTLIAEGRIDRVLFALSHRLQGISWVTRRCGMDEWELKSVTASPFGPRHFLSRRCAEVADAILMIPDIQRNVASVSVDPQQLMRSLRDWKSELAIEEIRRAATVLDMLDEVHRPASSSNTTRAVQVKLEMKCPANVGYMNHQRMIGVARKFNVGAIIQRKNFLSVDLNDKEKSLWLSSAVEQAFLKFNNKNGAGAAYEVVTAF
jgi:hypothetical protein